MARLHFDRRVEPGAWETELCWPPEPRILPPGDLEVYLGGESVTRVLLVLRERSTMLKLRGDPPPDAAEPDVEALLAAALATAATASARPPSGSAAGASLPDDGLIREFFLGQVRERLGLSPLARLDWPHAALMVFAAGCAGAALWSARGWIRSVRGGATVS